MELFRLAERQHGLFTRPQAHEHGLTDRQLGHLVAEGIVERLQPTVFRIRGTTPTWRQELMAVTLSVPDALASHRAAAALWELEVSGALPVEVLTQRWHRRHRVAPGVVVHETKDLVAGDIDVRDGIPCTSLVRTLVDLPAVVHEFKAGVALDQAHRRDPTILARVRARHLEVARRGRNGTLKLRGLLEERGLGDKKVDSGFERKALRLIRGSELPDPVTQWKVQDGELVAYLDIAWPDRLIGMECDSVEHHLSVQAFEWERQRRRMLTKLGWKILEFTYKDVTRRGPMVLRELGFHLLP